MKAAIAMRGMRMSGNMRSLFLAAVCCLACAGGALASNVLLGGENWRFETDLADGGGVGGYVAHHSSSAITTEWYPKQNIMLNLRFGQLLSDLEDETTASTLSGDGYYLLAGVNLRQELGNGGGLMFDAAYSMGWTDIDPTREYDHQRTHLMVGYLFGPIERSRFFAGVAYNIYDSDLKDSGGGPNLSFEGDSKISVVAGVSARSDSFAGTAEIWAMGEWGFRLGLAFGW